MSLLIRGGRVIDPVNKRDGVCDILVENGRIAKVAKKIRTSAKTVIDAKGKIVVPGLIDMHVHLREPGREDKETISSGVKAAVKGGFTSIACMPNTTPPCDNQGIVKFILKEAEKLSLADVYPIGAITKQRKGKELSEMAELKESGCVGLSDDGNSIDDAALMRKALEYASGMGVTIISHCEDAALSEGGAMNEGIVSTELGIKGIPGVAESLIIQRDLALAELSGAKIHIAHVSTRGGVEAIKRAKKKGVHVTAEVTPHHLALTDVCCKTYDTNTKVNPPLRTKADVKSLKEGLKDGTIDAIASDHAPHLDSEKDVEFDKAPFGMIGLETSLAVAVMELIQTKLLTWPELIMKMSCNPSEILGLDGGSLKEGKRADITIIDPEKEWVYSEDTIISKSKNTPFINWQFKACATDVIIKGRVVMRGKEITEDS